MVRILGIAALFSLAGCSTAGPFVTNVSSDGNGGLTIEKCMAHLNPLGWINNSDCTNTLIKLSHENTH
jgi:hypothetical protein